MRFDSLFVVVPVPFNVIAESVDLFPVRIGNGPFLGALAVNAKTAVKARKAGIILPPEPTSMEDDLRYMHTEEEFGELIFALVSRAQRNGLDPERALRSYTRRYIAQHTHDEPSY